MCGIAGILGYGISNMQSMLTLMADSLEHRGPNAFGLWSDTQTGIGMAHRRLSILDLSPQGGQPMVSDSGRYVLTYNGELYNHNEVRAQLEISRKLPWRGHSDTEVLLSAIEQWGVKTTLEQSNGMFAFAVWDRQEHQLILARDRMGEKPLYIGRVGGALVFASELKALRRLPNWEHAINRQALALFLRYGYVPAPLSIHEEIFKLPAASFITLDIAQTKKPLDIPSFMACTKRYWSLSQIATNGIINSLSCNANETENKLTTLLDDAIRIRTNADVPVGALLSGGIDSSLVSAIMQQQSAKPIHTFTIGFNESRFDEGRHAREVAKYIGSEHTEVRLMPSDALAIIPQLPQIYDEPFADPSQIPTVLVSKLARQHVIVALSGDGGDELFYGYRRYFDTCRIWRTIGKWPVSTRTSIANLIGYASSLLHKSERLGFRGRRLSHRINAKNFDDFYLNQLSLSLISSLAYTDKQEILSTPVLPFIPLELESSERRMMFIDQSVYLPDDILTKVDRASMAASLEVRTPLLDHRIVELSWRLPENIMCNGKAGKSPLRNIVYKHIPKELIDRPKQGFEIPLDDWLRGPLGEWMQDLLDPVQIEQAGYLNVKTVRTLINEHLNGLGNHGYTLWPILMFQSWLNYQQ